MSHRLRTTALGQLPVTNTESHTDTGTQRNTYTRLHRTHRHTHTNTQTHNCSLWSTQCYLSLLLKNVLRELSAFIAPHLPSHGFLNLSPVFLWKGCGSCCCFSAATLEYQQSWSFIKNKDLAWRDGLVSEAIVAQAGGLDLDVPQPRSGMHL